MNNSVTLQGKVFGSLTVVDCILTTDKKLSCNRLCRCKCGVALCVSSTMLRSGGISSCGCDPDDPRKRALWTILYQDNVLGPNRRRGFAGGDLSMKDFIRLCSKNCFYCGVEPTNVKKDRQVVSNQMHIKYNGLDKIDPSGFYEIKNVRPCCQRCNFTKNNDSELIFTEMVSGFDGIFNLNRTTEDIVNDIKKRGAQLHASLK